MNKGLGFSKDFNELHKEFVSKIVEDAVLELSEKDKKALLEHPDPFEHHFGYGMYIRNHYIHGKDFSFPVAFADDLSAEIVEEIIKRLQQEAKK